MDFAFSTFIKSLMDIWTLKVLKGKLLICLNCCKRHLKLLSLESFQVGETIMKSSTLDKFSLNMNLTLRIINLHSKWIISKEVATYFSSFEWIKMESLSLKPRDKTVIL